MYVCMYVCIYIYTHIKARSQNRDGDTRGMQYRFYAKYVPPSTAYHANSCHATYVVLICCLCKVVYATNCLCIIPYFLCKP